MDKNKKYAYILIGIILLLGLSLIIFISTRTYTSDKVQEIKHYEKVRDDLTINKTQTEIIKEDCKPCNNNTLWTSNETTIFNLLTLFGIVGLVYAVLNVFGLAGGDLNNKKDISFISGIIGLTIGVVIFASIFVSIQQSVINMTISGGCCP